MKTSRMLTVAAAAAVGTAMSLAGCGGGSSNTGGPIPPGPVITTKNIAYTPSKLSVHVGDKVTWLFDDGSTPHNVDGASTLGSFDSGTPQTGGHYTFTFTKAGSYDFHCDVHPTMTGTITVT